MFGKFLIIKRLAGLIWALSFFSLKSSVNFTSQNIPIENGLKKKVTWSYKGNDFKTVLSFFEKESGYFFQYDPGLIPSKKQFNIEYKQAVLGVVLRDFLQQNALDFQLVGSKSLVLKAYREKVNELIISGRVSQRFTGERIVQASVFVQGEPTVYYSNSQGVFQVRTKQSSAILAVTYPGFLPFFDTLDGLGRTFYLDVVLEPEVQRMSEANVAVKIQTELPSTINGQTDKINVTGKQLGNFSHLLGEPDILRVFSTNPGVVAGSEGVFGMYVRGGASDQNLILLDDVPIYNAYHMYGVFGVFNGDVVKNASFYRGYFPANQGGRLSSVVEVFTREGNEKKLEGSLSVGLLSSRLYFGGPLFSKRTTFSFAARRSFFDFLVDPVVSAFQLDGQDLVNRYNFWDINAKITHRFNNKSRLSLSAYSGKDRAGLVDNKSFELDENAYYQRSEDFSRWGNSAYSIRWDLVTSPTSNLMFKAYYTNYNYSHNRSFLNAFSSDDEQKITERSQYVVSNGINDLEASLHFQKQWKNKIRWEIGSGFIYHQFQPNKRSLSSFIDSVQTKITFADDAARTPEIFGYTNVQINRGKWGIYDFGLRGGYYSLGEGQFYLLPEPRFQARWNPWKPIWIKLTAARNRQFFHQLNNLTMGLPSDLWVPSTANFKPAQSRLLSAGTSITLSKSWKLNSEVFYRQFFDILEYKDNAVYVTSNLNWENSVVSGTGRARGVEVWLEKSKGRLTGWASYTYMNNDRLFQDLNQGKEFPARYDRRHSVYITAMYQLNKHWNVSGNWVYNSGFAYTLPVGYYPSPSGSADPRRDIYIYGARNNARTRDNHRLDFSVMKTVMHQNRVSSWTFGVYNMYNRLNPFYMNLGLNEKGGRSLYQVSLLPFMPFVSYKIGF